MNSLFESLNLSPQERRLVVGVLVAVFVFLNFWLVWPHFDDWKELKKSIEQAEKQLADFTSDADLKPMLQKRLADLEERSLALPSADQAVAFDRTFRRCALTNGVRIMASRPGSGRTRPGNDPAGKFFEEQVVSLDVEADNKQLVNFLHSLGASDSLIRVRDMNLRPGQAQTNLVGSLTLVASYVKDDTAPAAKSK